MTVLNGVGLSNFIFVHRTKKTFVMFIVATLYETSMLQQK